MLVSSVSGVIKRLKSLKHYLLRLSAQEAGAARRLPNQPPSANFICAIETRSEPIHPSFKDFYDQAALANDMENFASLCQLLIDHLRNEGKVAAAVLGRHELIAEHVEYVGAGIEDTARHLRRGTSPGIRLGGSLWLQDSDRPRIESTE